MLDIGMSELLVVGIVALIVVGPKDLPGMFHTFGKFTARVRAMGREFTRAMEQAAEESGVKDAGDALKAASNPSKFGLDKVKDAVGEFKDWDPYADGEETILPPKPEMDASRKEMAKKISDNAAKVATERHVKEAQAKEAAAKPASSKAKSPAKKPAAKKPAAKKPAAKKPAAKKPAAKKSAAKTTTTKKPAPKKAAPKTTDKTKDKDAS